MSSELNQNARNKASEYSLANEEDVPLKQGIFLSPPHTVPEDDSPHGSSHRNSPPPSRRVSGSKDGVRPGSSDKLFNGTPQKMGTMSTNRDTMADDRKRQEQSTALMGKSPAMRPQPVVRLTVMHRVYHYSSLIVNNKYFVALTTILTLYALTGDDLRLWVTDKPADIVFNILTIVCILAFFVEIVLSCLGKDDYFPGFFFFLDAVSTVTMVLDLTWVSEAVVGGDMDEARSGRTARMGAKVGRIVRVIRLIRIVKLYKAYYESRTKKKKRTRIDPVTGEEVALRPGEEDDDDWGDDVDAPQASSSGESLVGKKLSALTTRRVIILVLTMLLVLPLLQADESQMTPASPGYGADDVYDFFKEYQAGLDSRLAYERMMLRYLYYHNWFVGNGECPRQGKSQGCANDYYSNVFWVGVASEDQTFDELADITISARLRAETVQSWENNVSQHDYVYNYGSMPSEAQGILSSEWEEDCTVKSTAQRGFSLLSKLNGYVVKCPAKDLRPMERSKWTPMVLSLSEYEHWHFVFYFDLRPYVRAEAICSILTTGFVCIVLCVASVFFSKDATSLVLDPIETMITKVNMIRDNPLIAMKMADNEFKVEEMNKMKEAKMNKEKFIKMFRNLVFCREQNSEVLETVILDKTIIKLGTLLALGFGEAGAKIVSHNISNAANAMIEGTRTNCILGNTNINNFSTATEVLQGKVMNFVNQIAEIVHGLVDEFAGAANRNNGETFLLIWRLGENIEEQAATKMADMAVVAFTKVLGVIHRSPVLAAYRGHPGLQQRLGQQFRVNLTFGLHQGWAIEGAVGTEFKIDASYLSPHVSITESVLQATTIYGVSFVVSQAVVEKCSKQIANKCRLIDKVRIRGSKFPMCLYSLDLDCMSLPVDEPKPRYYIWNPRQRYRARQLLEAEKNRKWAADCVISQLFDDSPDIAIMRRRYTMEFLQLFNMGYQNYSEGEWAVARRLLSHTQNLLGIKDGPSMAILRFMETPFQFEAPKGWQGVHEFGAGPVATMAADGMRKSKLEMQPVGSNY